MVKQGDFEVTLINAETNQPFPEYHGPDGKVYIEVEPNAEYWIRIQSNLRPVRIAYGIEVDGEDLGYIANVKGGRCRNFGIWNKIGNEDTDQALTVRSLGAGGGVGQQAFWIGHVKVNVYESVEHTVVANKSSDFVNKWKGGKAGAVSSEKAVASQIGRTTKTTISRPTTMGSAAADQKVTQILPRQLLQSIILHCCTAVGLIHVGVLPKPESWEYHRKLHPADATTTPSYLANIEPTIMSRKTYDPSGKLVAETFYDKFDLTAIDHTDDEDDAEAEV